MVNSQIEYKRKRASVYQSEVSWRPQDPSVSRVVRDGVGIMETWMGVKN